MVRQSRYGQPTVHVYISVIDITRYDHNGPAYGSYIPHTLALARARNMGSLTSS